MQSNYTKIDKHHFNTNLAFEVGLASATIANHIHWWIEQNRDNERNFYDGHYWTYNSIEAFTKTFWYLTKRQIETALNKLIDNGYLIKGNYNKSKLDRTLWYALTDKYFRLMEGKKENSIQQNCEPHFTKMQNALNKNEECIIGITNIKTTDIKPDLETKDAREVLNTQEPARLHEQTKTQSSPICQKAFFETSDFQAQDNITQTDLDYLNTFSNSLTQEQEKYKRELGLFIIHRKTHKKHANLSELALRQLITKLKSFSSLKSIKEALIESVINGWAGVFEPKQTKGRFEYKTYNEYDTGDNSIYLRHALGLDKKDKS